MDVGVEQNKELLIEIVGGHARHGRILRVAETYKIGRGAEGAEGSNVLAAGLL
jgi:hypothetical protein